MKTPAFEYHWHTSIDRIDAAEWDGLFHHETIKSHALFRAVEYSRLDDVGHHYLRIVYEGQSVLIVPCFTYKLDLCVLMDRKTQSVVSKIRKVWKNFLYMKIFGVGSLIATCEQHFGLRTGLQPEVFAGVKKILNREIKQKLEQTGSQIIFVKEVPEPELPVIKNLLDDDFHFYYSLPNTFVPTTTDFRPYPQALNRRSQKRVRQCWKEFEELGLHWEIYRDFGDMADKIYELYDAVYQRSKNKFDRLNRVFFEQVNHHLPDKSYLAVSKDTNGDIKSLMLVIEEEKKLVPLYLGVNYGFENYRTVYFNTLIKTITEAGQKGKDVLVLGQTSYYPKILTGVFMQSLYLGFYSHKPVATANFTVEQASA